MCIRDSFKRVDKTAVLHPVEYFGHVRIDVDQSFGPVSGLFLEDNVRNGEQSAYQRDGDHNMQVLDDCADRIERFAECALRALDRLAGQFIYQERNQL